MSNKTSDENVATEEDLEVLNEVLLHNRETEQVRIAIEHILAEREQKDKRIKEQEDFVARKYHMFRCSNARLKESMKVLTKAYSELWEYLEQEHGDVLDEFLMREE